MDSKVKQFLYKSHLKPEEMETVTRQISNGETTWLLQGQFREEGRWLIKA